MPLRPVLLALWELPQNVLGAALLAVLAALGRVGRLAPERGRLFIEVRGLAVSLGWFVFWTRVDHPAFAHDLRTREHEWGHTFQSRQLGPLYLPLVGVPSVARVVYALAHGAPLGGLLRRVAREAGRPARRRDAGAWARGVAVQGAPTVSSSTVKVSMP